MNPSNFPAEALLALFQKTLRESGGDAPRRVERAYGTRAVSAGRLLSELTEGSFAWGVFEDMAVAQDVPGVPPVPRSGLLSSCEPLLKLMRASGELGERERLLREHDAQIVSFWQDSRLSDEARHAQIADAQNAYFDAVEMLALTFRAYYDAQRRTSRNAVFPLIGPRVRARPLLLPPLMAALFSACHGPDSPPSISLAAADLPLLDALTYDVAALAVSAFLVRTSGANIDEPFPFLFDDYFEWRGIDPRKRTGELRRQIDSRLQFLCSSRLTFYSDLTLWLPDPITNRRVQKQFVADGPFLTRRSFLHCRPSAESPDGAILRLGEWARPLTEARAMRGIFVRRLAEYDLGRQQWERRIGWYLTFQFNNQASKMTFEDSVTDGKSRLHVTPQHALKMKTILVGSRVAWEEMARTNPGKVLTQWKTALETLQKDGLIGKIGCLDGAGDGSDLPSRGRLTAMLERRFLLTPGPQFLEHLRAKKNAASKQKKRE